MAQERTGREIVAGADPARESAGRLLAVFFLQSTSPSYLLAVDAARGASKYREGPVGRRTWHMALFERTPEDAARALTVLRHLYGLKSLQIFAGGRPVRDLWRICEVLECYLDAAACRDHTAHCHQVIDDPFRPPEHSTGISLTISLDPDEKSEEPSSAVDRFLFPCSYLYKRFRFPQDHAAKPADLVQAAGVAEGCDWCPFFDPDSFRKVGTRLTVGGKSVLIKEG